MPDGLQRAVFYYVGKVSCLRIGEASVYAKHGSKSHNGG